MSANQESQAQQGQTIAEQFNTPPTSPWTEWAESFVRAALASNGSQPNGHNGAGNGHHPAAKNDACDDALMDCYNH